MPQTRLKRFKAYVRQSAETISCRKSRSLNEIAIRPGTARIMAVGLLARVAKHKETIKRAPTMNAKLSAIADMLSDVAWLSALAISAAGNNNNPH
jgi:hypothetical protein